MSIGNETIAETLKYIKKLENKLADSTPNELIREELKKSEQERKQYYFNNHICEKFIDFGKLVEKRTAKITRQELEINNKNMELYGAIKILEKILEGEKK